MDHNMMIEKVLTNSDLSKAGCLYLSKHLTENMEKNMGYTIPRNGAQVEILDNDKSYWVNLNKHTSGGYRITCGWNKIRDARGLKTGDIIHLYWKSTKFIFSMW